MYSKQVKAVIVIALFLSCWQIISHLKIYSVYLLPSPLAVFNCFVEGIADGSLITHISISIQRVFSGYFIAFVIAIMFSIVSLNYPKIMEYFDSIIQFMRNVPPLSLVPLLILWFGIGEKSKLIIIILASFFPMYLNIDKGFKSTDIKLIEVGKSFGYSKSEIFFRIILPAAIPDILVGMRIGMGYSYRAIIGAEMIASSSGLGYMINFAKSLSHTDAVIVGIIAIGILGSLCDYIFKIFINRLLKDTKGNGWN